MSFWFKLGAMGALIVALISWHIIDKSAAVEAAKNEVRVAYMQKLEEASRNRALVEDRLRDNQILALKKKNEEIKNISTRLDSALSSLQFYRSCYELTSKAASIGTPCPSRELSREDAEFLTREAARAQAVVEERDFYYGQYEAARRSLDAR